MYPVYLEMHQRLSLLSKDIAGRSRQSKVWEVSREKDGSRYRQVWMGRCVDGPCRVSTGSDDFRDANGTDLLEPKALVYEKKKEESGMTAEEEAELAELMSDDE
jgi:hypothetical protein